jgi:RNA polymerase sigma-70 factor (ECF subfamily)
MPDQSEELLILRAVDGERSALEQLLLRYHSRLMSFVDERLPADLRGPIAAEDVLQMAYVDAFRDIALFQPRDSDSFYRWLSTIVEHRLLDMIKLKRAAKRGGRRVPVNAPLDHGSSSAVNLLDLVAVDEHTPSRSAARHEAESAIHVALAALKDDYREAIRLRYIEGVSVADAAVQMGRTERAVHMLCYRGLRELRAALGRASAYLSSSE